MYHMAFIESSARVMTSALEYIKPIGIQVLRLVIDSYKHSHFNPISFYILVLICLLPTSPGSSFLGLQNRRVVLARI